MKQSMIVVFLMMSLYGQEQAESGLDLLSRAAEQVEEQEDEASGSETSRFACEYPGCGKSYSRDYSLKYHQMTHTGNAPFACTAEGCNERFPHKSRLKRHSYKHTGEKPYFCAKCGQGFSQRGHRKIHMANQHPE